MTHIDFIAYINFDFSDFYQSDRTDLGLVASFVTFDDSQHFLTGTASFYNGRTLR